LATLARAVHSSLLPDLASFLPAAAAVHYRVVLHLVIISGSHKSDTQISDLQKWDGRKGGGHAMLLSINRKAREKGGGVDKVKKEMQYEKNTCKTKHFLIVLHLKWRGYLTSYVHWATTQKNITLKFQ
jgi:hypothetical protein